MMGGEQSGRGRSTASGAAEIVLGDRPSSAADIVAIARHGVRVRISPVVEERLRAARAVVERYAALDLPAYGLTTALGAGVDTRLSADDLVEFQRRIAQGRAVGVGAPLPGEAVRAMMAARIVGMAAGGSGVSPGVFSALVDALNAGVHPLVPALGSIGAADLAPLAHMTLGLLGIGEVELCGERRPAAAALQEAGLQPLALGIKDGLALVVANSLSIGQACLGLADCDRLLGWSLAAMALNYEAFRANVTALDARALAVRAANGQGEAGRRLRALLAGGALVADGAARRLQDPLSYRCAPQIAGALLRCIEEARAATVLELGAAADNPLVLAEDGVILSQGNFDMTGFVLGWEKLGQALAHVATATAHRTMKLMSPGLSGLPRFLTPLEQSRTGFGTLQKTVAALEAAIRQLAMPVSLGVMPVADGIEDHASMAPAVVAKTATIVGHLRHLVAIELIAAAQAVELRGVLPGLAAGSRAIHAAVRGEVASLADDRASGPDVDRLAAFIAGNDAPVPATGGD